MYDGNFYIEEPCLVTSTIPWNTPNKQRLITAAAPEMGAELDAKQLGGKITICVLCYGNHYEMHQRCLDSIIRTVPLERLDLRVAANCVGQASLNYIRTLPVTRTYHYRENAYKYPIMRDMLYDPDVPISTNYFAWFDDNCHIQHNNWLNLFARDVIQQPANVAMYGIKLYYTFDFEREDPRPWLEAQSWHKGKHLRTRRGGTAPNGDCSHFCADWFFLMKTDVLKKCLIPPDGAEQKGGDILIGEALYQHGYAIKTFNTAKSLVYQPLYRDMPRRGDKLHKYPWHL
jgi:hypothetical protein